MATASITKVITALVVLEDHPIAAGEGGPEIAYTDADVDIYWDMVAQNGSVAPVRAGSTLTLRESLEAMLLPSGNNYSISIANWAYGSVDAFLERARTWLDAHGLVDTRIADSSGLSLDNVSTAADLVQLGEIALADPRPRRDRGDAVGRHPRARHAHERQQAPRHARRRRHQDRHHRRCREPALLGGLRGRLHRPSRSSAWCWAARRMPC